MTPQEFHDGTLAGIELVIIALEQALDAGASVADVLAAMREQMQEYLV